MNIATKHFYLLQKINNFLLYLFVFLLPWQTIWIIREVFYGTEKWQYGTIGLYISDIILITWIILTLLLYINNIKKHILKNKHIFIVAVLIVFWSFLSTLWAKDVQISFYFANLLFFGFALFFLLPITSYSLSLISNTFISSIFLQSIVGIIQFATQSTFSQKFLGLVSHDIWSGGNSVITTTTQRWLRNYGAMAHPNIFGFTLVCALLLVFSMYIITTNKSKMLQFFYLLSTSLFIANLLFTFSRTSWITFVIGLLILLILLYKTTPYNFKSILAPLTTVFGTGFVIVMLIPQLFFVRVTHDSLTTHNSINDRSLYLQHAITEIHNHPILGTGIGNYTNTVFETQQKVQPIWFYQPVHNAYLLIFTEIGAVGLVLFILFFVFIFIQIYQNKRNLNSLQKIYLLLIFLLTLTSLADHWIWTSHFGILLFFLFLSLSQKQS
jgi:O-antigen ligase